MKHFLFLLAMIATMPAAAAEKLVRFDDPGTHFAPALGKQVTAVFSDALVQKYFGKAEYPGLILMDLTDTHACFWGKHAGLDGADAKLKDLARGEQNDICVPRGGVSVKYAPQEIAGASPQPVYQTAANCTWTWKTGRGIGVWSEACKFGTGLWALAYDAAQDNFALSVDGKNPYPVLRQFHKKPDELLDVLLKDFKAKGLISSDTECRFEKSKIQKSTGPWEFYTIVPTGRLKEKFDALPKDEIPDPPCGEIGYAVDFVGYFMISSKHPDRVLYVNLGQDGTMFDPTSISLF